MRKFDSSHPLFICDLANNHFGDIQHAKRIIDELSSVADETREQLSVKFQFRNLTNYIHKDFKNRRDIKYIDRFLSTALSKEDFCDLTSYIKSRNMVTMATPFDEDGVAWCRDLDIEIIKIASASANDYPLIDCIATAGKPVIASTAGLKIEEIDNLVFRLFGKVPKLTVMHCVAIYPCDEKDLNLYQISNLSRRYPKIGIGFSTHERPETYLPVTIATSLGAVALERHVGIKSSKYKLNEYSSEPHQIKEWIEASKRARAALGPINRPPAPVIERDTLNDLKRGIYAKSHISKGSTIDDKNTYFAFPLSWRDGQFHAGILGNELTAEQDIEPDKSVGENNASYKSAGSEAAIASIILQVKGILADARIEINPEAQIELSHHYGLERFREFGAVLITCYNDEYAKKLVIQLPRQKHPYHFHKEKQETFQLLWGDMELTVNGRDYALQPGELYTVKRGEWHKFHSLHGAVVEEISTRATPGDSFYEDSQIAAVSLSDRKTSISNWLIN
jgi:N-acetylneuraminate synthase